MLRLPKKLQRSLDSAADDLLSPPVHSRVDFAKPRGEAALLPPNSVTWRIFKNPIALFVGGIAAVVMELADPAVRAGVSEHSSFRRDPIGRLRRTGSAAMVTVYGPRSVAMAMIAGIVRMHAKVAGTTADGEPYAASDAPLLTWVHATAVYGFGHAFDRYVAPLPHDEFDRLYGESVVTSQLYGAARAPASSAEMATLMTSVASRLQASPLVFEFLQMMREEPALPEALRWMQPMLVRAAVDLLPRWLRERLGLAEFYKLRRHERFVTRFCGALAEHIVLPKSPASQACVRVGLPITYLYSSECLTSVIRRTIITSAREQ